MPDHASLAHQSLGRAVSPPERALADALEAIFRDKVADFDEVARRLAATGVVAPTSGRVDWTVDLLTSEMAAINASLDDAYARDGLGA